MDSMDIKYFKTLLTDQLEELFCQAVTTVRGLIDSPEGMKDPLDRATFELERSTLLRIRDRESKLIRKIQKALDSVENGTFGICESCGREISIARLKARPVATHCIRCKTKMEAIEKASGF